MSLQSNTFIKYLDEYSKKDDLKHKDYIEIIRNINSSYICNNYSSPNFCSQAFPQYDPQTQKKTYEEWQKQHNIFIEPLLNENHKEKRIIKTNISKIGDLLTIIKNNNYDSSYSYNIDLKSLHKIKNELVEIDNMIGMDSLKESVLDQLIYFLQGLHSYSKGDYKHTILYGPPGTGKTEIAKLLGVMYSKIGILKNNIFKKVTRSDLIAGYLGQTAMKTKKVIEECLGGVLFIDEVYSLGSLDSDNYSTECIDTLCEALSDNKDNLMVIVAGYKDDIEKRFFASNKGLESRFIWKFTIDKYNYEELYNIFKKIIIDGKWMLDDEVTNEWFKKNNDKFKSYGRDVEVLFTYSKIAFSRRMYGNDIQERKLTIDDLNNGLKTFENNKIEKINEEKKFIMNTLYS